MDITLQQLKEAIDGIGRSFEEFKKTNDQRLSEIEKKGSADPLLEEKLTRINSTIDLLEDLKNGNKERDEKLKQIIEQQKELHEKYGEKFDKLETALKRPRTPDGKEIDPAVEERKAMWNAYLRHAPEEMPADVRKKLFEAKVLSISNDTGAGYLAPPEQVRELLKEVVEQSPMREIARVRSTGRTSIHVPKRTGTFAARWTAERGNRTETQGLQYGLEEVPTHEMYALVDITEQMLEDDLFDLEAEVNMEFTEQFAVLEGQAFILGDSVGKPEGILGNADVGEDNSGSAASIADAEGQADGLITLQHAIKTAYARNALWILNRQTLGAVRRLKDANGQYIWAAGAAVGNPATILGDPYREMPDMPAVAANAYPIAYGDFRRGYSVVDRISMSVLRDPFTQATSGAIRFIARRRVGGQVVMSEAFRKLKCAVLA